MTARVKRPAARLLVTDPDGRLLLFRFTADDRPPFWATPGGAVDAGESYEEAARRELREETGFDLDPGEAIAVQHVTFITLEGVEVDAEEHFFAISVDEARVDTTGHTELERRAMLSHHWFTPEELTALNEVWFPVDLPDLWQAVLTTKATS